jgi:YHS domain-containing protein
MARLLILFLWGSLIYFLWKLLFPSTKKELPGKEKGGRTETMVLDPNCNTFIPKAGSMRKKIGGKAHHFCSKQCLMEYREKERSKD